MKTATLILALSLVMTVTAAMAGGTMRCGTRLVLVGDSMPQVADKCGEPDFKEIVSGANERRVEQWYYRRGQGQFDRILTFDGIRLVRLEIQRP